MRLRYLASFLVAVLAGCGGSGGGGSATPPNPPSSAGTTMTVTFAGSAMPTAVAVAIGAGAFAQATLSGGQLTFVVPTGTSTFQLAYHCPPFAGMGTIDDEYVIDASTSDGTSPTLTCYAAPATTSESVSVNATALATATNAGAIGTFGYGTYVGSANGTASGSFVNGTNDIAALAIDASNNLVGVKFVRAQTIPGAINGGNPIVFAASDATTTSTMTVAGIPAGFGATPAYNISYQTASGTSFGINHNTPTYAVVASANMAAGDAYVFESNDADGATNQHIGATLFASAAGPVTVTLPTPWTYAGPAAAQYPTFTFAYSGFSGTNAVTDHGAVFWQENPTTEAGIVVYATPAYLGSSTTVSVPNLTALTGFLASAASGTTVSVVSEVDSQASLSYLNQTQSTGTQAYVQNDSTYVEP